MSEWNFSGNLMGNSVDMYRFLDDDYKSTTWTDGSKEILTTKKYDDGPHVIFPNGEKTFYANNRVSHMIRKRLEAL